MPKTIRPVHNHAVEAGPGLGCRESLIGDCIRFGSAPGGEVRERVAQVIVDMLGKPHGLHVVEAKMFRAEAVHAADRILAILSGTPPGEGEALREGLERIARRPCSVYVQGYDCVSVTGLQAQGARYRADGMCDPCTARFALRSAERSPEKLPAEMTTAAPSGVEEGETVTGDELEEMVYRWMTLWCDEFEGRREFARHDVRPRIKGLLRMLTSLTGTGPTGNDLSEEAATTLTNRLQQLGCDAAAPVPAREGEGSNTATASRLLQAVTASEWDGIQCADVDGQNWFDLRDEIAARLRGDGGSDEAE